jgi:DNA-binding XRE family transcriptional regulator
MVERDIRPKERAREWKTFRKRHYFTQTRLAQVLGVSLSTIVRVERGENIHPTTLSRFQTLKAKYAKPTSIFSG